MFLESLEVEGFRNLKPQKISFDERVTLLLGNNGMGKTSVLEAIYFLSHARSFRTNRKVDCLAHRAQGIHSQSAVVVGNILTPIGSRKLSCRITTKSSEVLLNDNKIERASDFFGQFRCVSFTAAELELVSGPPVARRTFIDRLICMLDPKYADNSAQFQRIVKNRNRVLNADSQTSSSKERELSTLDRMLIKYGREISSSRAKVIAEIAKLSSNYYQALSENSAENEIISLVYQGDFWDNDSLVAEDLLFSRALAHRPCDFARGRTTWGPQRDDLLFSINTGHGSHPARSTASQGQTRSIALATKLAAIDYIKKVTADSPVVLLDDVQSELDPRRCQALLEIISASELQIVLTTTNISQEITRGFNNLKCLQLEQGLALEN